MKKHTVLKQYDLFSIFSAQDQRDANTQLDLIMDKLSIEKEPTLVKDTVIVLDIPFSKKHTKRYIPRPFPMYLTVDRVYLHIGTHEVPWVEYLLTINQY